VSPFEISGGDFAVNTRGVDHYGKFGHHAALAPLDDLDRDGWLKVAYQFRRAVLFSGLLPHCSTRVDRLPSPRARRVVVGVNVFDLAVGPTVAAAPVHSRAYRALMAALFTRLGPDDHRDLPLVPRSLCQDSPSPPCALCDSPAAARMRLPHSPEGAVFCSTACLKAHHRRRTAASRGAPADGLVSRDRRAALVSTC